MSDQRVDHDRIMDAQDHIKKLKTIKLIDMHVLVIETLRSDSGLMARA